MIDRPYRKDDPRGWLPWHPKKPLKRLPMHREPTHVAYPLATVLLRLYMSIDKDALEDF
jgi:hypothetical protein